LHVTASAPGAESIAVFHDSRLLGRIQGAQGELTLDSASLGIGTVRLRAGAKLAAPGAGYVSGAPITIDVQSAAKK
jgi:hypothetical protein